MECEHGWFEEEIVDFILGRLPAEKQAAFERHAKTCTVCRANLDQWRLMIDEADSEKTPPPLSKMKRRLMKEVKPKTRRSPGLKRPVVALMAACAMLFTIFGTGWFTASPGHSGNFQKTPGATKILRKSGNQQIRYLPVSDHNVKGYVWMDGKTDELMLFLNGLSRISGKDYQAWLVSPNHLANAGLLKVDHGMAHLYYKGPQMEGARHIVVTVEPLGGSAVETGPQKVLIPLGQ